MIRTEGLLKFTKIKQHNTLTWLYKQTKLSLGPQKSLELTLKYNMKCTALNKILANWLERRTHKSKVFHEMKFWSHLRQSYCITRKFFFETIVLKKFVIVLSELCSHLSAVLSHKPHAYLWTDSSWSNSISIFIYFFWCEVLAPFWHRLNWVCRPSD